MKSLKHYAFTGLMLGGVLSMASMAYADDAGVIAAAGSIMNAVSLSVSDLLAAILSAVQGFGGLSWALKVAVVVMSLIGLTKLTVLSSFWDKMGSFKAWLAPLLGLALGILIQGGNITWAGVLAYMGSGAGAILLHQLLETVKAIPGIGPAYVTIINFIEAVIPAPLSKAKLAAKKKK